MLSSSESMTLKDTTINRILMICPQFRPIVGGYERAAERLSAALVRRGLGVTVVTERRISTWPTIEQIEGFHVVRYPIIYRQGFHRISSTISFMAYMLIKGRSFVIWHLHQYGDHGVVTLILACLFRRPVVLKLTSTGVMGLARSVSSASPILGRMTRRLYSRIDGCVVTSGEALQEALNAGIARDRIHLIPNGVDCKLYAPASRQDKVQLRRQLGIAPDCLLVLYVGRLSPEKNPDGLLQAWAPVVRAFPNARLAYIGEGPSAAALGNAVKSAKMSESVILAGQSDVTHDWYRASDLYVLPSHIEGLSNSLLEAMSCGLPVVSTKVSGSVDIFAAADIGEIVAVGDTPALATAVMHLLENGEQRRTCGDHARNYAVQQYSIDSVAARVVDMYASLCSEMSKIPLV